jgi:hypothetical protein
MTSTFLPTDDENPDFLRHKTPLPPARDTIYGSPARWYRIHVDYASVLIALCDYYCHPDQHAGTDEQREESAGRWRELQYYLMTGIYHPGEGEEVSENDFCAMVAACLDDGELDQTIINRYNITRREIPPDEVPPDDPIAETPVMSTCDRDGLFAAIRQMIEWMDELIGQFLDALSSELNIFEQIGRVIDGFPIVGEGPIDEYMEAFAEWFEDLAIGYNASFSQDIRESYWCDLFCLAVSSCSLNPAQMRDYFGERFQEALADNSIKHIVTAIASLGTLGPQVPHAMFFLCMWSLSKGNAFLGVEPKQFKSIMLAMTNDSDPDWAVLCDECPPHAEVHLAFQQSAYACTQYDEDCSAFEEGQGLACYGHPDTSICGCQWYWSLGDEYNITKIQMVVHLKGGATTTVARPLWIRALADAGVKEKVVSNKASYGAVEEHTLELFDCPETRIIEFGAKVGSSGGGSYVKIQSLHVWLDAECPPEWEGYCSEDT